MLLLERRAGVKGGFAAAQRSSTLNGREEFKHHNQAIKAVKMTAQRCQ
jgi:hypothetical protein